MDRLKVLLSGIEELRSRSAGTQKILETIALEDADHGTIERCVQEDRAVGLSVLKLANSARFGGRGSSSSLRDAIARIGLEELRRIAVAHQSRQMMNRGGLAYGMDGDQAWRGALAGAVGSELVATHASNCDAAAAFTAGLYRDCGKLAIDALPGGKEFAERLLDSTNEQALLEIERDVIGFDHPTVGATLTETWGFPDILSTAIRNHHEPPLDPPDPLSDCVHIGDFIATYLGYGTGLDGLRYRVDDKALGRLGVNLAIFTEFLCETKVRLEPYIGEQEVGNDTMQEAA